MEAALKTWISTLCLPALLLIGGAHAQDRVAEAIEAATMPLLVSEAGLAGPGGDWLNRRAGDADLVALGEQHATADIARFAAAWFVTLDGAGYDHAVIEIGPWSTRRAEALLRRPGRAFEQDALSRAGGLAYPFLFFQEEADFARMVVERHDGDGPALFGVDQEFIAAGSLLTEILAEYASTPDQAAAVQAYAGRLETAPFALGQAGPDQFEALAAAFADGPAGARNLVAEMQRSNRIYAPFTGRGGSALLANDERELGMKTYFLEAWAQIAAEAGPDARIFFKFGGNHVMRGHTRTHVSSLGNFLAEWSVLTGRRFFNVMADCQGGAMLDPRARTAQPCQSYFDIQGTPFEDLAAQGPVVIDLAALRPVLLGEQELSAELRQLLLAFDAYVIFPEAEAARFIGAP